MKSFRKIIKLIWLLVMLSAPAGCRAEPENQASQRTGYDLVRKQMIETQLISRGIDDDKVLKAFGRVERHRFVPDKYRSLAYGDHPLPIGEDQTISQPFIVAVMTQLLDLKEGDRVLEIGTGSGYQAAILGEIADEVYTIEIIEELGQKAKALLDSLGYKNIHARIGDGYQGWPEKAPFDGIVVTCAPPEIPQPLVEQLAEGGRMVIPVGDFYQELILIEKKNNKAIEKNIFPVRFVPMTGEAQEKK